MFTLTVDTKTLTPIEWEDIIREDQKLSLLNWGGGVRVLEKVSFSREIDLVQAICEPIRRLFEIYQGKLVDVLCN